MHRSEKKIGQMNPDNAVLSFDLHGVILRADIKKIITLALQHLKINIIFLLVNPGFWYHVAHDGAVPEDLIDLLSKKYSKWGLTKSFLIKLINTQKLNTDIITLIKSLKSDGYAIFMASNAWDQLLKDLMPKFPVLKTLFDGVYTPSKGKDNYYEKPDSHFFVDFKKYVAEIHGPTKMIVFVDDKLENVEAANKQGLIGIKFINITNLCQNLQNLGFKINPELDYLYKG